MSIGSQENVKKGPKGKINLKARIIISIENKQPYNLITVLSE